MAHVSHRLEGGWAVDVVQAVTAIEQASNPLMRHAALVAFYANRVGGLTVPT